MGKWTSKILLILQNLENRIFSELPSPYNKKQVSQILKKHSTVIIKKTTAQDPDFIALVQLLDAYLTTVDGNDHDFYDQYNQLDDIKYVLMAYEGKKAIGCGTIKHFDEKRMEIKRMFVREEVRKKGIAGTLLQHLEIWATELGYQYCILETGKRQTAAVRLYEKSGYRYTSNYEPYIGVENSVCMEKKL